MLRPPFLFFTVLLFSPLSLHSKPTEKPKKQADLFLEKALESYPSKSFQIEVQQEIFLKSIEESIKSSGFFQKKGKKFQLDLKGQPSSRFVFDGEFLWYQADTTEKLVFQFKEHPQIHLLNSFFSGKNFLEIFDIQQVKQKNQVYILEILPKIKIKGLKKIFVKVQSHISEVRIIWEDLNNWQKLSFSKPVYKSFPDNFFHFPKEAFQVIKKN